MDEPSKKHLLKRISVIRILRTTAWILVAAALLILFSGFFMTRMILNYDVSRLIHTVLIPIFFIPALYLHSLSGIMFALYRRGYANNRKVKGTLFILWSLVFVSFLVFYVPGGSSTSLQNQNGNTSSISSGTLLSLSEVSMHSTVQDCWSVIGGNVYDLTSYIPYHPGGTAEIAPYCGADGTQAFSSRGGTGTHSSYADGLLSNYLIGPLGSAVSGNVTINPPAPPGGYDDDFEEEHDDD